MVEGAGSEAARASSTRDRVRAAATELFGEKGYDGASMSELAERVGLAKPSLYNYYRSKEELLLDLVEQGISSWREACMAPFASPAPIELQLRDHLRLVTEFALEQPHLVAIFHLASSHVQGELAARVDELIQGEEREIRGAFARRLEQALAAGELDAGSAEDVLAFLTVFFHGLLFLQTNGAHHTHAVADRMPQVWRLLFRAISGHEPREAYPS
jgi:AcrR family transcriptional regulator